MLLLRLYAHAHALHSARNWGSNRGHAVPHVRSIDTRSRAIDRVEPAYSGHRRRKRKRALFLHVFETPAGRIGTGVFRNVAPPSASVL